MKLVNSLLGQIHNYYYYQTQTSINRDVNITFIQQKTKGVVLDLKLQVLQKHQHMFCYDTVICDNIPIRLIYARNLKIFFYHLKAGLQRIFDMSLGNNLRIRLQKKCTVTACHQVVTNSELLCKLFGSINIWNKRRSRYLREKARLFIFLSIAFKLTAELIYLTQKLPIVGHQEQYNRMLEQRYIESSFCTSLQLARIKSWLPHVDRNQDESPYLASLEWKSDKESHKDLLIQRKLQGEGKLDLSMFT